MVNPDGPCLTATITKALRHDTVLLDDGVSRVLGNHVARTQLVCGQTMRREERWNGSWSPGATLWRIRSYAVREPIPPGVDWGDTPRTISNSVTRSIRQDGQNVRDTHGNSAVTATIGVVAVRFTCAGIRRLDRSMSYKRDGDGIRAVDSEESFFSWLRTRSASRIQTRA